MLRLIKGKAEKSKLLEDLCRGSSSGNVCWIEYGWRINTQLPAQIDQYSLDRSEATKIDKVKLQNELKNNLDQLLSFISYSDIYLYGNFTPDEIEILEDISRWMDTREPDGILTRLNCTIQTNDSELIVSVLR